MKSFWQRLIGNKSSQPRTHTIPLRLETLEDRIVPTFAFYGGPLLPNVAIQGIYLGSDWSNTSVGNPNPASTSYFDGFLKSLVSSPFMTMLHSDGYNVNKGTFTPGVIDPVTLTQGTPGTFLYNSQIQADIQAEITAGAVQQPNGNTLYTVFVEDNVPVATGGGYTSTNAFTGTDSHGNPATIYYSVITTPGGSIGNGYGVQPNAVTQAQEMTIVGSHETAEAATDPSPGNGWYDYNKGGEIGDIV